MDAAAWREICCVVIATTSASNGFGFIVGRNPGTDPTTSSSVASPAAHS